ncbi:olfactory receptor 1361-like [Bufo gargarizans]|uniref:olfactory receptor 1361-like n=1 Tax=Bufo gargarizans TaxID=30331 RepID=UPI001CF28925|nr:olfactory receptor 1361-like [Bufo gargarizans]
MHGKVINTSFSEDFHLLAFSRHQNVSFVLIVSILFMYLLCMFGNLIIIAIVWAAPRLHTPMYFFLCNLSTLDMAYVSSILPKLLDSQITGNSGISFTSCCTQLFMSVVCITTEFLLLSSMAFDRYVAFCLPLKYPIIMNNIACIILSITPWTFDTLNALLYIFLISHLSFCNSKDISHFYCETKAFLRASCSDIKHVNIVIVSEGFAVGFIAFGMILTSYIFIISSILKIKTSSRRLKIFSSCSSHLTVVLLFCGSLLGVYMNPDSKSSTELDMIVSLLYVAVVPALNPLVYSLRNKEVLNVLRKHRVNS